MIITEYDSVDAHQAHTVRPYEWYTSLILDYSIKKSYTMEVT